MLHVVFINMSKYVCNMSHVVEFWHQMCICVVVSRYDKMHMFANVYKSVCVINMPVETTDQNMMIFAHLCGFVHI